MAAFNRAPRLRAELIRSSVRHDFFHAYARSVRACGRVIILGTPPESAGGPRAATAQRALEGLTRSIGKEFGRGTTAQLVQVAPGAEGCVESTLRFLLSARSAYVSGLVPLPRRPRRAARLPDLELTVRRVAVDRDHLAAYDRVCGFRLADTLPATYPHLLARTWPARSVPLDRVSGPADRVSRSGRHPGGSSPRRAGPRR